MTAEKKPTKRELIDLERVKNMQLFDRRSYSGDLKEVCGMDEVGRGPLAGPVVVAAVSFFDLEPIAIINDSKKMTETRRNKANEIIRQRAKYSLASVDNNTIDEINILNATRKAFVDAYKNLDTKIKFVMHDSIDIKLGLPKISVVAGDNKSYCIAAASIIAKVYRDNLMVEYDKIYPQYSFAKNKGYGTKEHIEAINKYGITPIHRKSFLTRILEK